VSIGPERERYPSIGWNAVNAKAFQCSALLVSGSPIELRPPEFLESSTFTALRSAAGRQPRQ